MDGVDGGFSELQAHWQLDQFTAAQLSTLSCSMKDKSVEVPHPAILFLFLFSTLFPSQLALNQNPRRTDTPLVVVV